MRSVGERIKTARLAAGVSAEVIAVHAGVSRGTLWRYEKGSHSPTIETLDKIAAALDYVDAIDLLLNGDVPIYPEHKPTADPFASWRQTVDLQLEQAALNMKAVWKALKAAGIEISA